MYHNMFVTNKDVFEHDEVLKTFLANKFGLFKPENDWRLEIIYTPLDMVITQYLSKGHLPDERKYCWRQSFEKHFCFYTTAIYLKGLVINVLRNSFADSTNKGISSQHDCLTLIGPDIAGVFEPSKNAPPVCIGHSYGMTGYSFLVPAAEKTALPLGNYMAGGNFAYSCDGRFPSRQPLSIHDRRE